MRIKTRNVRGKSANRGHERETIMSFATLAVLFAFLAATPAPAVDSTAAPSGFYPRSATDGLLEVGTWVWSNSGDISCAWEGDLPAADSRCWKSDEDNYFDYHRARIIDVEEWPGGSYYRIMYEPFHPGQSGMPQWTAAIDEVFEGYNLPQEVREFSNLLVRTNW